MIEFVIVCGAIPGLCLLFQDAFSESGPLKHFGIYFRKLAAKYAAENRGAVNWYNLLFICLKCWGTYPVIVFPFILTFGTVDPVVVQLLTGIGYSKLILNIVDRWTL